MLTLIKLGFLRVVVSGEGVNLTFVFQGKLIKYHYNVTQLLNKLVKVGW